MSPLTPTHLDLKKDKGLTIQWPDGTASYYSIRYLRRMSPSADMVELRKQMAANPLTVLPARVAEADDEIVATDAELVGHYAIKLHFSDGHESGIYSWEYLRQIDPEHRGGPHGQPAPGGGSGAGREQGLGPRGGASAGPGLRDGLGPLDHGPPHDRPLGL